MEKVLCVKRKDLPETWVKPKSIVKLDELNFFKICSHLNFSFIERQLVEKDPDYKQIIPYIVIQTEDLQSMAVYKRKGSEKRLHDLWSIGIGGHINPVDSALNSDSLEKIICSGMERELQEELSKKPKEDKPVFLGVINEEETDVGSVHIGAVFRILTNKKMEYTNGDELVDFQWVETKNAVNLNLELWSRLALDLIKLI